VTAVKAALEADKDLVPSPVASAEAAAGVKLVVFGPLTFAVELGSNDAVVTCAGSEVPLTDEDVAEAKLVALDPAMPEVEFASNDVLVICADSDVPPAEVAAASEMVNEPSITEMLTTDIEICNGKNVV
jgi:hypothetical protein